MQLFIALFASSLLAFSSLNAPKIVIPEHVKPTNYDVRELYIKNAQFFPGTMSGYCGPFSVSVALMQLGILKQEPTLDEWHAISQELRVDPLAGGISVQSLIDYFAVRDFEISFVNLHVDSCDPQYYTAQKMEQGCVAFALMMAEGVGGHVEAILGSESCKIHTNSWGSEARIDMKGRFTHTNMTIFNDAPTEAFIMVSCPVQK